MEELRIDPKPYLQFYYIIDLEGADNTCEANAQRLCSLILSRYSIEVEQEILDEILSYHHSIHHFLEDFREYPIDEIKKVLTYLKEEEYHHVLTAIILCWSLPTIGQFFSSNAYNRKYKENIHLYNSKITNLIHIPAIQDFCLEALSVNAYVPIHCIDYIWFYLNESQYTFRFHNSIYGSYFRIILDNTEKSKDSNPEIILSFNLCYVLEMGLARVSWSSDPLNKGPMYRIIFKLLTDPTIVASLINNEQYREQLIQISRNPSKYLDPNHSFPQSVTNIIRDYSKNL